MYSKTILIQTEITEGRAVIAHFLRLVYDDDGSEIGRAKAPHTVTFMPDANHDVILKAVNNDITTREGLKWPAIELDEWARACGHCVIEHTPEIVKAYAAFTAQQEAALAATVKTG